MECAFHNLGRIRLIWGRLWAAVAPHLVSAACHSDPHIAALAVDHMRRLIANLLARAELSHFTYQVPHLSSPAESNISDRACMKGLDLQEWDRDLVVGFSIICASGSGRGGGRR